MVIYQIAISTSIFMLLNLVKGSIPLIRSC